MINRREAIKGLGLLGLLPFVPAYLFDVQKKVQFIGIGPMGARFIQYLQKKGMDGSYCAITDPDWVELEGGIDVIPFKSPLYAKDAEKYSHPNFRNYPDFVKITKALEGIFQGNQPFVIVSGLDTFIGQNMLHYLREFLSTRKRNFIALCYTTKYFFGETEDPIHKAKRAFESYPEFHFFSYHNFIKSNMKIPILNLQERFYQEFYKWALCLLKKIQRNGWK